MSRHARSTLIALIAAALIAVSTLWLLRPEPVEITVAQVTRGSLEYTVANTRAGTVKACRRAKLAPATGGQIAHLYVTEGDRVEKGAILLEIWNQDLRAQLHLAKSEAQATRATAKEVCLRADSAQRDADRLVKLKQRDLVAEEAVDQAVTNAKAQKAACKAARDGITVAEEQIDQAQAALERTILRAPFAGRIADVTGEVGEYVTPSPPGIPTPPAVDLIDDSCIYVTAPIDEVDAPAIHTGMRARITLDAFPDIHFEGRVWRIAPYVQEFEKQARTVDVDIMFTDVEKHKQLLPGYSADAEVIIDVRHDVLRVPTEAILPDGNVLVYDPKDRRIHAREITTGLSNWQLTQVLSGLKAGEWVVTSVDREGVEAGALAKPEQTLSEPTAS